MIADVEHRLDKLGLFILAGLVVLVLGLVVGGVFFRGTVPDKGDVLLGGISTGLILFLRDLVNAVRSSWDAVTQSRTMDALSKAGPVTDNAAVPESVAEAADQTAQAATDEAEKIGRKAK